jgi:hypothetical protein
VTAGYKSKLKAVKPIRASLAHIVPVRAVMITKTVRKILVRLLSAIGLKVVHIYRRIFVPI